MVFEREDWKLFRNIDTLCQKAGVSRNKIPQLIIKELVDNALDVSKCELKLIHNSNGFSVRDYGDGLSEELLKSLLSINRPMITSKLLRLPTRGALGNGLRVVVGAIISTNGRLVIETNGKIYETVFLNDGSADIRIIGNSEVTLGTKFNVYLGDSIFRITERDLSWGRNAILMSNGNSHSCKTSPFWYTSESFFELINSYTGKLKDFLLLFEGMNKLKVKNNFLDIDSLTNEITFEQSEDILHMLRKYCKKINIKKIGNIGDTYSGLGEYAKKSDSFVVKSAKGKHNAEIPFLVETWIRIQNEYVPGIYVNKTPITGEYSWWYDKGTMKLFRLGLNIDVKLKPSQMIVNVTTPYMPITSDGKSPDFSSINDTIQQCLTTSKNKAKKIYVYENSNNARNEKEIFLNNIDSAIAKASGYGEYMFSQRQLYYAIRPYIMNALDKQPEYTYFCRLLTEYENEYGEIENLYRDPRGVLYHPHLGQEIPIGTMAVREYERPEWTFNKILYSEKEGFFPILKEAKFPERYDCALLTSKGYASRAVKDLFDLLGETDEEILFFCIHDADSAGTMIYQTLQEETLARPGRRVKIINLGLDPWEANEMGLEVETFESKSKRPVANYVRNYMRECRWDDDYVDYNEWLQTNRIELNAMTTPQFLEWLEDKISEYDNGKVVPDRYTIKEKLEKDTNNLIYHKVMNEILKANNFDEIVKSEIEKIKPLIEEKSKDITYDVTIALENERSKHWTNPVNDIAKEIVK